MHFPRCTTHNRDRSTWWPRSHSRCPLRQRRLICRSRCLWGDATVALATCPSATFSILVSIDTLDSLPRSSTFPNSVVALLLDSDFRVSCASLEPRLEVVQAAATDALATFTAGASARPDIRGFFIVHGRCRVLSKGSGRSDAAQEKLTKGGKIKETNCRKKGWKTSIITPPLPFLAWDETKLRRPPLCCIGCMNEKDAKDLLKAGKLAESKDWMEKEERFTIQPRMERACSIYFHKVESWCAQFELFI